METTSNELPLLQPDSYRFGGHFLDMGNPVYRQIINIRRSINMFETHDPLAQLFYEHKISQDPQAAGINLLETQLNSLTGRLSERSAVFGNYTIQFLRDVDPQHISAIWRDVVAKDGDDWIVFEGKEIPIGQHRRKFGVTVFPDGAELFQIFAVWGSHQDPTREIQRCLALSEILQQINIDLMLVSSPVVPGFDVIVRTARPIGLLYLLKDQISEVLWNMYYFEKDAVIAERVDEESTRSCLGISHKDFQTFTQHCEHWLTAVLRPRGFNLDADRNRGSTMYQIEPGKLTLIPVDYERF